MKFWGLALLALVAAEGYSQSFYWFRRDRPLILTGGTGVATYLGELANPGDYFDSKLNVVAGLKYQISNRIAVRSEMTWFQLQGTDALANDGSREKRNLSFKSDNFEINATGQISLFENGKYFYQRPKINFYGFAGIGLLHFNPKTEYLGSVYELQPLQTEGVSYSRFTLAIPFGGGVRFRLSPFLDAVVEGGYRKLFTDYLDDVSTVHLGPGALANPVASALSDRRPEKGLPAAAAGSQRGNPENKDGYWLLNIKFEYYMRFNFADRNLYRGRNNSKRR